MAIGGGHGLSVLLRGLKEHIFVWVALEAQTKIIPVIHIGRRKREDAMRFVHEVWQRLAPGAPPIFTTMPGRSACLAE